jgi:hypothetical protein
VYWDQGELLAGSWGDANVKLDHNLYWNAAGRPVRFEGKDLAAWQATGKDAGSIVADPRFVDPKRCDFRLRPGSPAEKIGFEPFDYTQAGVTGSAEWRALAASPAYPKVEFAPEPPPAPPLSLNLTFEDVPVGQPCPLAQNNVEGHGELIAVTDETAATGKRSLKITDAPGLQNVFDPHLVFTPNHTSGVTKAEFALRCEPGVSMYHEWRTWPAGAPYKVGPSFDIRGGELHVAGQAPLAIPAGQWVRFEIEAALGDRAGKWSLTVLLPGREPVRYADLPLPDPGFRRLDWFGFTSMANERTVFYLDDIRLRNER